MNGTSNSFVDAENYRWKIYVQIHTHKKKKMNTTPFPGKRHHDKNLKEKGDKSRTKTQHMLLHFWDSDKSISNGAFKTSLTVRRNLHSFLSDSFALWSILPPPPPSLMGPASHTWGEHIAKAGWPSWPTPFSYAFPFSPLLALLSIFFF